MGILRSVMSLLFCVQVGLAFSVAGQENTCDANGSVYNVGEWHFLDSDHCMQTECTSLPTACIHVKVYELGQKFQPSECEQCTCDSDGIARCLVADCAPPALRQPYKLLCVSPGPSCYVDLTRSQVIPGGEPVWVDSCTKCHCHDSGDAGYWEGNR
uniref:VWFC domain-containing protein n=1 Tax=Oncorhynchus tshawytscha TaxID=74940 RepID=A0A8C8LVM5_ONCTS